MGPILTAPPDQPNPAATYVFYLHGRIVQDEGRKAISPKFGPYEYDAILRAFASQGFTVVSEVRPRHADPSLYADRIVRQVRRLLDAGVPGGRITIIGASMGGFIAMNVSNRLDAAGVGYVFMGSCDDETRPLGAGLHGEILSIYEATDKTEQSCSEHFAAAGAHVTKHDEVRIETGLGHGFLYRPLDAWVKPAIAWARHRSVVD